MLFVANRPGSIATVSLDPIDWAIWSADWLSRGLASQVLRPLREVLDCRPVKLGTFDPVYAYVVLANGISAGGLPSSSAFHETTWTSSSSSSTFDNITRPLLARS